VTSWRYNLTDYLGTANGASRGLSVRAIGDINTAPADVGGNYHPPNGYVIDAPASGVTLNTEDPYVAGTLVITRVNDGHVYVEGTDYTAIVPDQWTNLTIPTNTDISISYIIDATLWNPPLVRSEADLIYQERDERNQPNGYPGLTASGRMAPSQLGSNTPLAGKYLDGTGAWITLPSGGSSGGGGGSSRYATLVKLGAA